MGIYPSFIAGTDYRSNEEKSALKTLAGGELLHLEHEPDNIYDKNAVKVIFNKRHIGYIPDKHDYIANILSQNQKIYCVYKGPGENETPLVLMFTGSHADELEKKLIKSQEIIDNSLAVKHAQAQIRNIIKTCISLPCIMAAVYLLFSVINPSRTPGLDLKGSALSVHTGPPDRAGEKTSENNREIQQPERDSGLLPATAPIPIPRRAIQ